VQNPEPAVIKVFDIIPVNLVVQVDLLLEENGSNNRIRNEESLSVWSKERFVNNKDRFKYILALADNKVVGIIILWKRTVQYKGKSIVVGGLGGVGVQKEYRGKGIATKMLTLARETLDRSECEVAFLGTDTQDPQMLKIYGRVGFVPMKKAFSYTGKSGEHYEDKTAGMIAPIHSLKLFNEILGDQTPFDIGTGTW
jgi:ribosomal protein S18 acetylase RimI-like enzyme